MNPAGEIKLWSERRAGELLREMEKNRGAEGSGSNQHQKVVPSHDERTPTTPTLNDLGISYSQSSRWQSIADIPEPAFEQAIQSTKTEGKELTSA